jgi:hypothetical protein
MSKHSSCKPFTDASPLQKQKQQGEGVYFSGKKYTEMTMAERAAYRKSLMRMWESDND